VGSPNIHQDIIGWQEEAAPIREELLSLGRNEHSTVPLSNPLYRADPCLTQADHNSSHKKARDVNPGQLLTTLLMQAWCQGT